MLKVLYLLQVSWSFHRILQNHVTINTSWLLILYFVNNFLFNFFGSPYMLGGTTFSTVSVHTHSFGKLAKVFNHSISCTKNVHLFCNFFYPRNPFLYILVYVLGNRKIVSSPLPHPPEVEVPVAPIHQVVLYNTVRFSVVPS